MRTSAGSRIAAENRMGVMVSSYFIYITKIQSPALLGFWVRLVARIAPKTSNLPNLPILALYDAPGSTISTVPVLSYTPKRPRISLHARCRLEPTLPSCLPIRDHIRCHHANDCGHSHLRQSRGESDLPRLCQSTQPTIRQHWLGERPARAQPCLSVTLKRPAPVVLLGSCQG